MSRLESAGGPLREKLWTRNFVLAIGTNLFIYMVFYLLMTSMALYALERFQAADSAAGFASSAFIVGALVSRFFAGILLDKVGRRRILLLALLGVGGVIGALADIAWILLIIALARPQTVVRTSADDRFGIDLVIALDSSGSMAAEDFRPRNRLAAGLLGAAITGGGSESFLERAFFLFDLDLHAVFVVVRHVSSLYDCSV